jgi:hypothetical protein
MNIDENPMSRTEAFDRLLDGRVGPVADPRRDPTIGSRAHRRATHPANGRPRTSNR